MTLDLDERERLWRRARFQQILDAQSLDVERMAHLAQLWPTRRSASALAVGFLDRLRIDGDLQAFKDALGSWSKQPGFESFGGFGQMFVNQLANAVNGDEAATSTIVEALTLPRDEAHAVEKLSALLKLVEQVRKGAHPAPRRAVYVVSFFWALQDHLAWPCFWSSAERSLVRLGWLDSYSDLCTLYSAFRAQVLDLDEPEAVEAALFWFDEHPFVGLDPTLRERAALVLDLNARQPEGGYRSDDETLQARRCAQTLVAEMRLLGDHLAEAVSVAAGRSLTRRVPKLQWKDDRYRADGWVRWGAAGEGTPAAITCWATADGVYVGLHPGWYRDGWYPEAASAIAELVPNGYGFHEVRLDAQRVSTEGKQGASGDFVLARFLPGDTGLDDPGLAEEIIRAAADLQPALDRLVSLAGGGSEPVRTMTDDPLSGLVRRFHDERGYPIEKDRQQRANREEMARQLSLDELPLLDVADFRIIYNGSRYGHPGPQSILNTTVRDASPAEYEAILERVAYLLWDESESDATRIDRMLDDGDLGMPGLKDSVILKLLAITHPERYLPVFPLVGDYGKLRFVKLLGLQPPDPSLTRGQRHLLANDALRQRLDPFFPGDPWAQAQFLYWLGSQDEVGPAPEDRLATLADELLVDIGFLRDIVELLHEKGQVVFYGPPGTGKTYLARELAKVLAESPNRRMIVQFHPSTSYEDFFEGYRPEAVEGRLTYRLVPGPLALLAQRAELETATDHVMVIDEINRANLPKVLGELLFLLEYREERIRTVYRPEEAFELPKNVLFIGTMNTSDRSIALIDAALRRRFHFVPFFPNEGAIAGLLDRWLERHGEPPWVGELVAFVNDELIVELGGPHLQLGPSHFMRSGLDESVMERIWTYDIFPFIEDQLFGEQARIERYRFAKVLARYQASLGGVEEVTTEQSS